MIDQGALGRFYEPGEFASEQVVTIVGPKLRTIENVRILGPVRDFTQVELSRTEPNLPAAQWYTAGPAADAATRRSSSDWRATGMSAMRRRSRSAARSSCCRWIRCWRSASIADCGLPIADCTVDC